VGCPTLVADSLYRLPGRIFGNILADARPVLRDAPWMIVFPSLMLSVTILGLNLFGDGIRDVLDPRMRI